MIRRPKLKLEEGMPSREMMQSCLREFMAGLPRLEKLRDYYEGRHAILTRSRSAGLPNMRVTHAFPRYISTMASGYLIGSPVSYSCEGAEDALEHLLKAYEHSAIDSVDAELARDASVYGKGVELIFADEQARPRSAALSPLNAFVVYDESVACEPLLGMSFMRLMREDGNERGYGVQVYTDEMVFEYETQSLFEPSFKEIVRAKRHFFGCVPLIEYWNDENERGDFETVIPLIDAYDLLQSDRLNDKQQFVDALLVLYGCTLETDEKGRTPGRQLREDKALSLPDCDARAEWLCKQLNEADTEVLKNALRTDIHKMSMVPDLTDEQFAGNSSGVAMKYKLLGLEQLTKIKERWFREALRLRLKAYAHFLYFLGDGEVDVSGVRMIFTRALPVNALENAQTLAALKGILPLEELARRAMQDE